MRPLFNRLREQMTSPWLLLLCLISMSTGILTYALLGVLSLSAEQIGLLAPIIVTILTLMVGMLAISLHQHSNDIYELFKGALSVVDASLIIFDKNDEVVQFNSAAAKSLKANGISLKRGLHINDMLHQQASFELKTQMERDIWIRSSLQRRERNLEHGTVDNLYSASTDTHSQASLHRLSSGHIVDFRTDITAVKKSELAVIQREEELKKARIAAETSARAKSEFLANMSHEIRTPMNGVVGMIELLLESGLNEDQMIYARTVSNSGLALLTIINDILDFSKIEADKLELDKSAFNLRSAVEDVATLLSTRVQGKDIELVIDYANELPQQYIGDEGRVRQILTNLAGNAVKFTEQGHVVLSINGSVTRGKAHLTVSISDTGIGIPQNKIQRIFSEFEQVDSASNRKFEGTGLGLAISSKLVRLMGGEIQVQSEVGSGSTFSFVLRLPVAEAKQQAATPVIEADRFRALVVDDLDISRQVLQRSLQSWGLQVDSVGSAAQALTLLGQQDPQQPYSLLVLDYPSLCADGQELSAVLAADQRWSAIPLLLLSSLDQSALKKELESSSKNYSLAKPARSEQLRNAVASVLYPASGEQCQRAAVQDGQGKPATTEVLDAENQATGDQVLQSVVGDFNILIVEDNEVNQLVITSMLDGLQCELADNGGIGVEKYQSYAPDLVFMDVSMPQMNGLDATRAIRQIEQERNLPRCPIIALTANAMHGDREKCLAAGMDDFISKPVLMDELDRQLLKWLGIDSSGQLKAA